MTDSLLYLSIKLNRMYKVELTGKDCMGIQSSINLEGNSSPTASFYVFVGVLAFLHTLIALAVYVLMKENYELMDWMPIAVSNSNLKLNFCVV